MVNKVCPDDQLMAEARAVAERIAANAPISARQAKKALDKATELDRLSGYAFEIEAYNRTVGTEDRQRHQRLQRKGSRSTRGDSSPPAKMRKAPPAICSSGALVGDRTFDLHGSYDRGTRRDARMVFAHRRIWRGATLRHPLPTPITYCSAGRGSR